MSLFGYPEPTKDEQILRIGDEVWTLRYSPYGSERRTVDMVMMREWVNGAVRWEYHFAPFRISGPNHVGNTDLGKDWFRTEDDANAAAAEAKRRHEQSEREYIAAEIERSQKRLAEINQPTERRPE